MDESGDLFFVDEDNTSLGVDVAKVTPQWNSVSMDDFVIGVAYVL
ncbi:MAG: hypothetical protein QGG73_00065 [Candidatus Hydrogenedentes bacterium]|nr:hypothetical protein [Candidatus Hydrogenedentota bacterium]